MRWKKPLLIVLGLVIGLGIPGYFVVRHAITHAWIRYGEYDIRTEGTLKVGDLAPNLTLQRADGEGSLSLAEAYAVHPLVLVFGSYT